MHPSFYFILIKNYQFIEGNSLLNAHFLFSFIYKWSVRVCCLFCSLSFKIVIVYTTCSSISFCLSLFLENFLCFCQWSKWINRFWDTYWSTVMISLCLVWVRANLNARSLASDPELTKKQTESSSGIVLTTFSAHKTISSWRKRLFVDSVPICFVAASTTFGWQWPTGK